MNKQIILVPGGRKALRKIFDEHAYNQPGSNKQKNRVFIADNDDQSAYKNRFTVMFWSTNKDYFPVGSNGAPIPNVDGVWMLSFCDTVDEIFAKINEYAM